MQMTLGGKERILEEFRIIFDLAGFDIVDIKRALLLVVIENKEI
jgi:hypothetical protein